MFDTKLDPRSAFGYVPTKQDWLEYENHFDELEAGWHELEIVYDVIEPHAKPGQFCPTCGDTHCNHPNGHDWNEFGYCRNCGADGNG